MDIFEKVKGALSHEIPDKVSEELEKIPEGIVYGKKIRNKGSTVTYHYSEKQKAILEILHGIDIEENTEKFIGEGLYFDEYGEDIDEYDEYDEDGEETDT